MFNVDENRDASVVFQQLQGYAVPSFFFINSEGHIVKNVLGFEGDEKFKATVADFVAGL